MKITMKKQLIFLFSLLCSVAYAQTYQNGTWYSLYDETEHAMNTQGDYETSGVFAPTAGTLNVKWRYEWIDLFGAFKKIDTKVLESANNGSNTNQVGSLAENTDKNSNTTESFTVSKDINWIKFNREGYPTHKVILYHLDIPLAKHILLASGEYGTTSSSYDFGTMDVLTTSKAYTIALRSFLTAGDITVRSSNPEIFHVGSPDNKGELKYKVGANACASANGTATAASGGTLGKIDNYAVKVYFTPKEATNYGAVITITDGVSTATVSLIGVGRKMKQTITWEPETTVLSDATIATAEASSGLEVTYAFDPENILTYEDGALTILNEGTVTVTASQEGNEIYEPAEPVVRTITIFPAVSRSEYSAAICEGETYNDDHFQGLTQTDQYFDTIPNVYGGDSVITLSLTVNPVYQFEQNDTIREGDTVTWQDIDLSVLPLGDTTFIVRYSAITGCDSVLTLHLHVQPSIAYGAYQASFCEGDSVEFEGKWYFATTEEEVLVAEKNQFGGDSIVVFTAIMNPTYFINVDTTIRMDDSLTWHEQAYSQLMPGVYTFFDSLKTLAGCDSVYTLQLTVTAIPTYGVDTIYICGRGEVAYYDEVPYTKPAKKPYTVTLSTPNQYGGDSIVELWILAANKYDMTFTKTIIEGTQEEWQGIDLSVLPAGDTTLVVMYNTIHGCDSVYTLILTVDTVVVDPMKIENADGFDSVPCKFFRNGQMYIRKNGQVYNLQGIKVNSVTCAPASQCPTATSH